MSYELSPRIEQYLAEIVAGGLYSSKEAALEAAIVALREKSQEIPFGRDEHMDGIESAYECRAVLVPDHEEGGYTVFVRNLRGVHSHGDTEEEALDHIREAFAGAIGAYVESGRNIPWCSDAALPDGAIERRILVNA